jgi:hypothetical protein
LAEHGSYESVIPEYHPTSLDNYPYLGPKWVSLKQAIMDLGDDVEEDVCRVCRLEAHEENPMVHPCRCSGSVRWVHPDW